MIGYLGIFIEFISRDVIDWEHDLHVVLFGLFDKGSDLFRASRIEERVADLTIIE